MSIQIIRDDHRLQINSSEVAASIIDGEVIIVHFSTGRYFSLRGASANIWPAIEACHTIGEVTDAMVNAFAIPYERAHNDLLDLLYQLLEEGVISLTRTVPVIEAKAVYHPPETWSHDGAERSTGYLSPRVERYDDMQELVALDGPMPPVSGDAGRR